MAIFDRFRKKVKAEEAIRKENVIGSAAEGEIVHMEDIPDSVFSQGILGTCCGIKPTEGKVFAPIDGEIVQVSDTKHAVGIAGASDIEILIHVGIDTVDMNGEGFDVKVREKDKVKKGDLILTMDLDKIKAAGHPDMVIIAVANAGQDGSAQLTAAGRVKPGEDLFRIS